MRTAKIQFLNLFLAQGKQCNSISSISGPCPDNSSCVGGLSAQSWVCTCNTGYTKGNDFNVCPGTPHFFFFLAHVHQTLTNVLGMAVDMCKALGCLVAGNRRPRASP